jgi:hypothetical protein
MRRELAKWEKEKSVIFESEGATYMLSKKFCDIM